MRNYDEEMAMFHGQKSFSVGGKDFIPTSERLAQLEMMKGEHEAQGFKVPDFANE